VNETARVSPCVESYRFGDVVRLWARERLEHEIVVACALARAVVCDGLRLQSVDGRWLGNDEAGRRERPVEFRGYPYVGYTARPEGPLSVLRISALHHLLAIVERCEEPDLPGLFEEFILREDFRSLAASAMLAAAEVLVRLTR
jgi:hypothetical protein